MAKLEIDICEHECNCCINKIYSSMEKDAKAWKEVEEMKVATTPLHRAAAAGNTAVAVEVLNLMPSLGRKLNEEGRSPLHLAIAAGHRDTAQTLARIDKQLVRVKGMGGITPLMQSAAGAGDDGGLKLLARLLVACPESVADVNNRHQTVVHVALEYGHCDAACVLVDWLRRRDQISSVLAVKDVKGNTVLHTAAQSGCVRGAHDLVHHVKINTLNFEEKTALDVAIDNGVEAIVELLRSKGAKTSSTISPSMKTTDYVLTRPTFIDSISRSYYYLTREFPLETRNTILVVAALIITATYQGVLQPPGGVYPPDDSAASVAAVANHERPQRGMAGRMVMEKGHYRFFMMSNTLAFTLSIMIIIFVVPGSPVFLILHFCLVFMSLSYLLALDAISNYNDVSHVIFFMALYAIVSAFAIKLFYYFIKALLVDEDSWFRRLRFRVVYMMRMQYNVLKLP